MKIKSAFGILGIFLILGSATVRCQNTSNMENKTEPPVDLNKPVENPSLVLVLETLLKNPDDVTREKLDPELNRANYLVPIKNSELHTSPPDKNGRSVTTEKSKFNIVVISSPEGKPFIPLFTDWNAIKKWSDQNVQTLVLPAKEAWNFVLNRTEIEGAVINPGYVSLPLDRKYLESLKTLK